MTLKHEDSEASADVDGRVNTQARTAYEADVDGRLNTQARTWPVSGRITLTRADYDRLKNTQTLTAKNADTC